MSDDRESEDPGRRLSWPSSNPGVDYANLQGSTGAAALFRPDRIARDRLAALELRVHVPRGARDLACELRDVSQNGVALHWPVEVELPHVGELVAGVRVTVDAREIYRGGLEVISLREEGGERLVGGSFRDGLLNTNDLLTLQQVRGARGGGLLDLDPRSRVWSAPGYEDYKAGVCEMRLFLEDAREQLTRLEGDLPYEAVHGAGDPALRAVLVEELLNGFVPNFLAQSHRIDAALRGATPGDSDALRHLSQRQLDPLLMQAAFFHRARSKPLGYPGDFMVMRYIYEGRFEGVSLFSRALHLAATETDGARMIRGRKDVIRDRLLARAHAPGGTVNIALVGSGPCEEVLELLQGLRPGHRPVRCVLFDQAHDALAYSLARLRPLAERAPGEVKLVFLHESIRDLLRGPTVYARQGPFDAVVCSGLLDYLVRPSAVALCASLVATLAPGGELFVGNVVPELRTRWLLEHHLDWFVHYRSREELYAIASESAPGARVEPLEEASGYNPLVAIHARG
jgi:SAM-dependent methyltransferase